MDNYFLCSIKNSAMTESGKTIMRTEKYLVKAASYTAAEEKFYRHMDGFSVDFEGLSIVKRSYREVICYFGCDRYYEVKVCYTVLNESDGSEKRTGVKFVITAADFNDAAERVNTYMKGEMGDWEIAGIQETPVMDFIENADAGKEEEGDDYGDD